MCRNAARFSATSGRIQDVFGNKQKLGLLQAFMTN